MAIHGRAGGLGELYGVMPDGAGAAGDQKRHAGCGTRYGNGMIGRHRRNAEAGADFETRFGRQANRLRGGEHDVFGAGAERAQPLPVPHPDALANTRGGHAVAHQVDFTGTVAMRNDARIGDLARRARARLHVGGVDAGRGKLDAHFTRPGPRRFDLAQLEHRIGRAVLLIIGGAHFRFLLVTRRGSEPKVSGIAAKHQPSRDRRAVIRP